MNLYLETKHTSSNPKDYMIIHTCMHGAWYAVTSRAKYITETEKGMFDNENVF